MIFVYKRSASDIVVLCSDQKFMNVSHKKIQIKIEVGIFLEKWIEIRRKYKKQLTVTTL